MDDDRKRLENFLLGADNRELMATILAFVRMAEEMREIADDLKDVIATHRNCRSGRA